MKVASSADWRARLPFETAVLVADVVPGEATRCFSCGPASEPRERDDLWAFKHRHPIHHDGFVRFYCREHVPVVVRPEPAAAPAKTARAPRARATGERAVPRRAPAADPVTRPMCPNCFVEVSATGECGMCGAKVA